ncbi:MAG: UDP-N-acetylmuramoyl-L-alanyl-D-glutamate--2,6-diaminopimelate ligase [Puniceicoccales bacterium]|nr:UDP-N-acetylmuramoyl-L-alanyl-D-glutamate--2,6-diaminopimelate ligase [Puniceicoccales bacterium]
MRTISELFFGLKCKFLGDPNAAVDNLTDCNIKANKTSMFFAIHGNCCDGNSFIADVVGRGCGVIVTEHFHPQIDSVTFVIVDNVRMVMAVVAKRFFCMPDEDLYIYCVTGTNGKTSITYLLDHLEAMKTAVLGTIGYKIGAVEGWLSNTTPGAIDLFNLLDCARRNDCKVVAMEASSHALYQKRTHGLSVDVAIFSNLSEDHLEYHDGIDNYFKAKEILFLGDNGFLPDMAIVNADDKYGRILAEKIRSFTNSEVITYGTDLLADFHVSDISLSLALTSFVLNVCGKVYHCEMPLVGKYNVMNVLAAVAAASSMADIEVLIDKVKNFPGVPGRLQRVVNGIGVSIFVDYAHTEDALINVLSTLKPLTKNKLIVVFGCGGNRDKAKRPKMSRAALTFGDVVIATSDNPRDEAIKDIFLDMKNGVYGTDRMIFVEAREEAIHLAISVASEGDTILIAGKGHEKFQQFSDRKIHFDDVEAVLNVLAMR